MRFTILTTAAENAKYSINSRCMEKIMFIAVATYVQLLMPTSGIALNPLPAYLGAGVEGQLLASASVI
jgi:hypothetical protein